MTTTTKTTTAFRVVTFEMERNDNRPDGAWVPNGMSQPEYWLFADLDDARTKLEEEAEALRDVYMSERSRFRHTGFGVELEEIAIDMEDLDEDATPEMVMDYVVDSTIIDHAEYTDDDYRAEREAEDDEE